jgi:tetratricopeptide (TPR) repeat protein
MQKAIAAATLFAVFVCGSAGAQIVDRGARERALPHYRTGWEYMHAEAWPEAEKSFSQAVDVDTQFELAYYGLGQALMAQKRFIEATAAYVKCRDLYRAQAGRRFTSAQEAQRYREERLTELDDLARQLQSGPQSLRSQERLRQIQEQRKVVQESFQRGGNISIEDTVPSFVSLALGSAYFRSTKFADAEREYKAAINSDAKIGEAHNNLAVVYLMTGRADDAEREVKAAERVGFKVQPALKDDIKKAKQKGTNE